MTLDEVANQIAEVTGYTGTRLNGRREVRCPAHADSRASLSLSVGRDDKVILHCHAGCDPREVLAAVNLTINDLFPPKPEHGPGRLGPIIATYDYTDEHGQLLYQVVRCAPKDFRQRRPARHGDPDDKNRNGWVWSLAGVRRVLYQLPSVLDAAKTGQTIWVTEGEKDVRVLTNAGAVATCNPQGAGKWRDEYTRTLKGAERVVIVADNDAPGIKHAAQVYDSLTRHAIPARIVRARTGKDAADHLAAGHTLDDFDTIPGSEIRPDIPGAEATPPRLGITSVTEPAGQPGLFRLTDLGNAERLIHRHGKDLHYCHPWHKWLIWDGARWQTDDTAEIHRRAQDTVRGMYAEAGQGDSSGDREATAKWAIKSEERARLQAMVALAATLPSVPILPHQLDTDPWALTVTNGTIDLRTGKLRDHQRGDLITKLAPVAYDPDALAPRWQAFLDRVMGGNHDLIDFLQLATGYSLTGDTGEECVFIPYGHGRNGKSKFLGALGDLLGDYAQQIPRETLMHGAGGIPNDLAKLKGARFATAIETGEGRRLDEQLVKQLTGGDKISARFLHAEFFDFQPEAKLWLATNHKPRVTGTDEGIWSRIRLIPFEVVIPPEERDPGLAAKLRAELPGILAWAVRGCLNWQHAGLKSPESVRQATEGYRVEQDILGEFLAQRCVLDANTYAYASDLHMAYIDFTGDRRISPRAFGLMLRERGLDKTKMGHPGRSAWLGIGLLNNGEDDD